MSAGSPSHLTHNKPSAAKTQDGPGAPFGFVYGSGDSCDGLWDNGIPACQPDICEPAPVPFVSLSISLCGLSGRPSPISVAGTLGASVGNDATIMLTLPAGFGFALTGHLVKASIFGQQYTQQDMALHGLTLTLDLGARDLAWGEDQSGSVVPQGTPFLLLVDGVVFPAPCPDLADLTDWLVSVVIVSPNEHHALQGNVNMAPQAAGCLPESELPAPASLSARLISPGGGESGPISISVDPGLGDPAPAPPTPSTCASRSPDCSALPTFPGTPMECTADAGCMFLDGVPNVCNVDRPPCPEFDVSGGPGNCTRANECTYNDCGVLVGGNCSAVCEYLVPQCELVDVSTGVAGDCVPSNGCVFIPGSTGQPHRCITTVDYCTTEVNVLVGQGDCGSWRGCAFVPGSPSNCTDACGILDVTEGPANCTDSAGCSYTPWWALSDAFLFIKFDPLSSAGITLEASQLAVSIFSNPLVGTYATSASSSLQGFNPAIAVVGDMLRLDLSSFPPVQCSLLDNDYPLPNNSSQELCSASALLQGPFTLQVAGAQLQTQCDLADSIEFDLLICHEGRDETAAACAYTAGIFDANVPLVDGCQTQIGTAGLTVVEYTPNLAGSLTTIRFNVVGVYQPLHVGGQGRALWVRVYFRTGSRTQTADPWTESLVDALSTTFSAVYLDDLRLSGVSLPACKGSQYHVTVTPPSFTSIDPHLTFQVDNLPEGTVLQHDQLHPALSFAVSGLSLPTEGCAEDSSWVWQVVIAECESCLDTLEYGRAVITQDEPNFITLPTGQVVEQRKFASGADIPGDSCRVSPTLVWGEVQQQPAAPGAVPDSFVWGLPTVMPALAFTSSHIQMHIPWPVMGTWQGPVLLSLGFPPGASTASVAEVLVDGTPVPPPWNTGGAGLSLQLGAAYHVADFLQVDVFGVLVGKCPPSGWSDRLWKVTVLLAAGDVTEAYSAPFAQPCASHLPHALSYVRMFNLARGLAMDNVGASGSTDVQVYATVTQSTFIMPQNLSLVLHAPSPVNSANGGVIFPPSASACIYVSGVNLLLESASPTPDCFVAMGQDSLVSCSGSSADSTQHGAQVLHPIVYAGHHVEVPVTLPSSFLDSNLQDLSIALIIRGAKVPPSCECFPSWRWSVYLIDSETRTPVTGVVGLDSNEDWCPMSEHVSASVCDGCRAEQTQAGSEQKFMCDVPYSLLDHAHCSPAGGQCSDVDVSAPSPYGGPGECHTGCHFISGYPGECHPSVDPVSAACTLAAQEADCQLLTPGCIWNATDTACIPVVPDCEALDMSDTNASSFCAPEYGCVHAGAQQCLSIRDYCVNVVGQLPPAQCEDDPMCRYLPGAMPICRDACVDIAVSDGGVLCGNTPGCTYVPHLSDRVEFHRPELQEKSGGCSDETGV